MIDGAKPYREHSVDTGFGLCRRGDVHGPNMKDLADRLALSLEHLGLGHSLYQVPSVHKSISIRCSDDLSFCKPHFIRSALDQFNQPVLYIETSTRFLNSSPPAFLRSHDRSPISLSTIGWPIHRRTPIGRSLQNTPTFMCLTQHRRPRRDSSFAVEQ